LICFGEVLQVISVGFDWFLLDFEVLLVNFSDFRCVLQLISMGFGYFCKWFTRVSVGFCSFLWVLVGFWFVLVKTLFEKF
jgi:hypothetical protein